MDRCFSIYFNIEKLMFQTLERLPLIGFYAKTRGWYYVLAWAHRVAGILLVVFLWFHIYTLTALLTPELFAQKMRFFQDPVFVFFEWALAIPVIFHALNGGRLILYETFYSRPDPAVTRGVVVSSFIYVTLMGVLMILGDQEVSPILLWLYCLVVSAGISYIVALKLQNSKNSPGWKLHRITGSFLLLMIPAHLLFMHLQPGVGHDASIIIPRMQSVFIKTVNLLLLTSIIYHATYGLIEMSKDYIDKKILNVFIVITIIIVMGYFLLSGARLTLFI